MLISIHSPHARGDQRLRRIVDFHFYFNPLPSCEGRRRLPDSRFACHHFNPLPSCEGRPARRIAIRNADSISIHSPHARGDLRHWIPGNDETISIHSPHARGDAYNANWSSYMLISIHSPHARGDVNNSPPLWAKPAFQSTPLMRGETHAEKNSCSVVCDFNPLPSCEGRLGFSVRTTAQARISIHSPHARGDKIS